MSSLFFPHEWLAVCLVLATVCGFAAFSWNHYSESLPISIVENLITREEEKIQVTIDGAVRHPGPYLLPVESQLGSLLTQAEPLAEADLRGVRRNQKLHHGQHVEIKERPWMTVYVSGAVQRAGAHRVREGTPLSALPDLCPLHPQAEQKGLRSKRLLISEEHIHVPYQQL